MFYGFVALTARRSGGMLPDPHRRGFGRLAFGNGYGDADRLPVPGLRRLKRMAASGAETRRNRRPLPLPGNSPRKLSGRRRAFVPGQDLPRTSLRGGMQVVARKMNGHPLRRIR